VYQIRTGRQSHWMKFVRIAPLLTLTLGVGIAKGPPAPRQTKRMSFSNRLLLNRAAVGRLRAVEVMLAVHDKALAGATRLIERTGGHVRYTDSEVGYVRAEIPIERLVELVGNAGIDAYQISSLSRGSWYRDGPPQTNAEMFRGFERVIPDVRPRLDRDLELPSLTAGRAQEIGYAENEDAGVGEWLARHPSFDGRGVTIALLESAQPEFTTPILGNAKSLDGRDVPKLAGILNTIATDEPDETRVELTVQVQAQTAWNRIGDRTYILPRPSTYRFGIFTIAVGPNLLQQFGVLEDEISHEVRIDTNGDADFRNETPVSDVNDRFEPRSLKLGYPQPTDVAFVMGRGRAPHTLHIYLSRGGHQTMTLSVAAGSKTENGVAFGVAPGARVLLVRTDASDYRVKDFVEGYLETIKRPDVDILSDTAGIVMPPDTAADFFGLLFHRMAAAYGKPIFHSANNMWRKLGSASALGDAFAVGGSIGPKTFAALFGGAPLLELTVHPTSAAGPALDGAVKPDFVAPVDRIAADLKSATRQVPIPKNAPTMHLPAGYQIGCCTSASGPYAAGIGALLMSAARQERLPYSLGSLGRALRGGAQFLPTAPTFEQGSGMLSVNAAWGELKRRVEMPRITSTATVVHTLAPYAALGQEGQGIFERDGWTVGMSGTREIRFRRESGPASPVTYRLSWTGNDGTFATQPSIVLPLDRTVSLPISIAVNSAGAHGAILNVHDPATDAIVFRTQATVVATEQFDRAAKTLRLTGRLPLLARRAHYVPVPEGIAAMSIELEVLRGSVRAEVLPSHGLYPNYYGHILPQGGRTFTVGRYDVVLPNPAPGTWTLSVENTSGWAEANRSLVSTDEAEYRLTARLLGVTLQVRPSTADTVIASMENLGAVLREPVIQTSFGTLRSHHAEILPTGLPNQFEIDIPANTPTLSLQLRGIGPAADTFELYLYDCTTGECFSYNFTLPAERHQLLTVRRPKPGRWVAAVNAAPFPTAASSFELDEIVTSGAPVRTLTPTGPLSPGAKWTQPVERPAATAVRPGDMRVLVTEILDLAVERDESEHQWETRALLPKFADRPVAVGTSIYRLP
jgi:hypothetical protein